MNALVTIIPLLLIRFLLLGLIKKDALKRAAFFAPLVGKEKTAYVVYQISNLAIFVCLGFLNITTDSFWLYTGLVVYGLGILLLAWSTVNFSTPKESGINTAGLYQFSRNPMYMAYFVYYLGCVLLTQSLTLLVILLVFQMASHFIILSEERWCAKEFGAEYTAYMQKVRRYI